MREKNICGTMRGNCGVVAREQPSPDCGPSQCIIYMTRSKTTQRSYGLSRLTVDVQGGRIFIFLRLQNSVLIPHKQGSTRKSNYNRVERAQVRLVIPKTKRLTTSSAQYGSGINLITGANLSYTNLRSFEIPPHFLRECFFMRRTSCESCHLSCLSYSYIQTTLVTSWL